ncbi:NADP-specific glutamate dehydrogenase [Engelhardtia mirabilis]|uniref:Glutamate dehydrogenase n=1 Tax=Engelhardtia mirabilis TaxID=2528011 RepID=A0A518BHJ5_9BACT|nr:NAD(P)-specific glutamate dehydrogenase [Planctomycetes bacterium Pla133]QDV00762.1 NAD(P)-specific glutamate dehydrogenase [Planctomycetes bacterium Pla86]
MPTATTPTDLDTFMDTVRYRNPGELEFQQAVEEVVESLMPMVLGNDAYMKARILDRITEPDRVISFRVTWEDDRGEVQLNRGYRIQFNNTIGPYKGGLRFHPSVTLSVLKFLAFEQIFKNSLTGLPMGGGKGGSDFDPKGKSDREVMRFCQSFMTELFRHVGQNRDVPAGDIGVGAREIGFLFGHYKRLTNSYTGVLTGKGLSYGGSLVRTEATGYGAVYFAREMLGHRSEDLSGRRCLVSGSGNVATYAAQKLQQFGAKVLTLSDSGGTIYAPGGIDEAQLAWIMDLKEVRRGRISEAAEHFDGIEYHEGAKPWQFEADSAFPCATQNEIDLDAARQMTLNGIRMVCEGANMPTANEAVHHFQSQEVLFAPGKAANAGGVAVSGLEQSQNSQRYFWDRDEVDRRLQQIMSGIHAKCVDYGERPDSSIDYVRGANVAGFVKVADAMVAYGLV